MESLQQLRKICARSQRYHKSSWYAKKIRHISIYFTWLLLHTSISANQTTILQIILAIIGALCFILNRFLLGVVLLQISYILDCVDGEIARYRKQSSLNGIFLDMIGHFSINPFIWLCFAVGIYFQLRNPLILVLGFVCLWFSLPIASLTIDHVVLKLLRSRRNKRQLIKEFSLQEKSAPDLQTNSRDKLKPLKFLRSKIGVLIRHPHFIILMTGAVIVDGVISCLSSKYFGVGVKLIVLTVGSVYYTINYFVSIYWAVREKRLRRELTDFATMKLDNDG